MMEGTVLLHRYRFCAERDSEVLPFYVPSHFGEMLLWGVKFRYAFKLVLVFPQNHLLVIYLHSHSLIIRAYGLGP
jgi:hypothetical protein